MTKKTRIQTIMFIAILCLNGFGLTGQSSGGKVVSGKAGPILHEVQLYAVFSEIPESWTIAKFKNIAKPKPSPEGHVWYVLRGTATNNSTDSRSINITTYKITDKAGTSYKADVRNSIYQPEGTGVASITVEPGATQKWLAFYAIPLSAQGLSLKATDMTFVPDQMATFPLPDPTSALAASSGQAQTETTKATTTPATNKPTARTDGIKLQEVTSEEMGFEILIPEGAKALQKSKWATTYSLVLKDGINEININLTPMSANSLDELVNTATEVGGKEILEKNSVENGFLVVKKRASLIQVWLSRKGKNNSVTIKVTAPDSYKALALEIANSLKVN